MFVTELDSFVQKFHQLRKAGLTAHLDLDTHAGNAWVGLRVQLSHVPGPAQHSSHHQRRGPAYQRRQLRRQAAQADQASESSHAAETAQTAETSSSSDALPTAQASEASNVTENVDMTKESEEKEVSKLAEEASFQCDMCDFESNWANGLNIHMARKHADMEQLDGSVSLSDNLDDDDKYLKTIMYWKEGRLGTVYQTFLDVMDVIETSDLREEAKDVEKEKVLETRKKAFGNDYQHFPPWNAK